MEVCKEFYNLIEKQIKLETTNTFNEGIIIIVDTQEKAFDKDFRIVCISTHKKENNLKTRQKNHYQSILNSILRKHISKCLFNKNESSISNYIKNNFKFILINVKTFSKRITLKKKIIGTLVKCKESKASKIWLGNKSSTKQIKNSGLWLVQHVGTTERLTYEDLEIFSI